MAEYFCSACRTPFVNSFPLDEEGRCALCRLGFNGYDAAYTYGSYEGTLRKLIHIFKFDRVHTLARPLGALIASVLPREQQFDAIVPMPLHWRRRWERGFNQSELLANEISRRWSVPVVRAVRRVKPTVSQAGLTNAKRRANVSGAFSSRRPLSGAFAFWKRSEKFNLRAGARVLLIDDVLTTGATAAACARALKRAGAKHVTVLAVARTDRRMAVETFSESSSTTGLRFHEAAGGIG
jgi:ComF family protein